jgi:hypothetical protein
MPVQSYHYMQRHVLADWLSTCCIPFFGGPQAKEYNAQGKGCVSTMLDTKVRCLEAQSMHAPSHRTYMQYTQVKMCIPSMHPAAGTAHIFKLSSTYVSYNGYIQSKHLLWQLQQPVMHLGM